MEVVEEEVWFISRLHCGVMLVLHFLIMMIREEAMRDDFSVRRIALINAFFYGDKIIDIVG